MSTQATSVLMHAPQFVVEDSTAESLLPALLNVLHQTVQVIIVTQAAQTLKPSLPTHQVRQCNRADKERVHNAQIHRWVSMLLRLHLIGRMRVCGDVLHF